MYVQISHGLKSHDQDLANRYVCTGSLVESILPLFASGSRLLDPSIAPASGSIVTQFSRHFWPSFWSTVLSANRPIWLGTWLARPSLVPPRHVLHRSGCGWGTPFRPQGSRRGDRGDSADARYMIVLVTMLHVTRPTALAARDRRQPSC